MNNKAPAAQAPRLVCILGGARSGKSTFAEQLATKSGRSVAFIATATANDDDMRLRIAHHRASRPANWPTIEEPLDLSSALRQAMQVADVILLDCMTLWLGNWLWHRAKGNFDAEPALSARYSEEALQEVDKLLTTLAHSAPPKTLLVVSNEVGMGTHPEYAISRVYRDILGRVNQRLASAAERVYLMVAGLAVDIKKLHEDATL
jgi:adenosylcobinamide kinase/adenosylcobinamide-phosphate guanylyltransferase